MKCETETAQQLASPGISQFKEGIWLDTSFALSVRNNLTIRSNMDFSSTNTRKKFHQCVPPNHAFVGGSSWGLFVFWPLVKRHGTESTELGMSGPARRHHWGHDVTGSDGMLELPTSVPLLTGCLLGPSLERHWTICTYSLWRLGEAVQLSAEPIL